MKQKPAPKTLAELLKAVANIGAKLEGISLTERRATHDAPQGKKLLFSGDSPSYPVFVGLITGPSSLLKNRGSDYPWTKLGWLHSGTGGVVGTTFQYEFRIWADDVPKVAAEFLKHQDAVSEAFGKVSKLNYRRVLAMNTASDAARMDFNDMHAEEIEKAKAAETEANERMRRYLAGGKP